MAAEHTNNNEFTTAFSGLAKHLFPDGCPEQNLESIWPLYDRTAATSSEALNSYERVVDWSHRHGLSSLELQAMTVTALCMLPQSQYKGFLATESYFDRTVKAIIPRERMPICVVERLISGATANETGRCAVLQFIYLAASHGCIRMECLEKRYYSFIVHWVVQAETCIDCVRLLLFMSPKQRYARRLFQYKARPGLASLSLLLQHYAGVRGENRPLFSDREWEKSFQRFQKATPFVNILLSDLDHSWNAYQLSKVTRTKPSATFSLSILIDRWFQGSDLVQRNLLETSVFMPLMNAFLVQHVLPIWDGRNSAYLLHALPLNVKFLPYLERHFIFGSPEVQFAIGEYLMRFVEDGSDCVSEVLLFASDLILRALLLECSLVVGFIAFDFLDRCPLPPDPFLFNILALSTGNWERVCNLIVRYKDEKLIENQVLEQMISSVRELLFGGSSLQDLCLRTTARERLSRIPNTCPAVFISGTTASMFQPDLAKALEDDWPEVYRFWRMCLVSDKL